MRTFFLTILFVTFIPVTVSAHGDSPSLEVETGGYLIDIGYDKEGIRPNEEVTFNFDLLTTSNRPAYVPFQSINVDIMNGPDMVLQRVLVNDAKFLPTMPVTFDTAGEYHMHVAYIQSGATIAESTFDLDVEPFAGTAARAENTIHYVVAVFLVSFAAVAIVTSYLRRRV